MALLKGPNDILLAHMSPQDPIFGNLGADIVDMARSIIKLVDKPKVLNW